MFARLLLTSALFSALALAQGGGGMGGMGGGGGQMGGGGGDRGGMGEMGGGGGGGMPRAQRASKFDQIAEKLKLNKEQKEQAQTILDAGREEAGPLRESLMKARLGIADALVNAKGDDEVKKAQEAYAAEVAKMTGVEAKTFAKIYALLKPNQQAKASQAWDLMADIFSSGGRGGGGGGRGRGQSRDRN
jgi:Spy/CpxP family protein refolding chaperone